MTLTIILLLFYAVGMTYRVILMFLAVTDVVCLVINFICNVIPRNTEPNWFIVSVHYQVHINISFHF